MMNYACDFSQSETEKYSELILLLITIVLLLTNTFLCKTV